MDANDRWRHSQWLEFLYRRLMLAKDLLTQDGVIMVSINDENRARLELLMDEVFLGRRVGSFVWRVRSGGNDTKGALLSDNHEHVLVYANTGFEFKGEGRDESAYSNPDNDPRGAWFDGNPVNSPNPRANLRYTITSPQGHEIPPPPNGWRWSRETLEERMSTAEIRFTADGKGIRRRTYLADHGGLPASSPGKLRRSA